MAEGWALEPLPWPKTLPCPLRICHKSVMSGEPQNSGNLRLSAIWLLSISFFWLVLTLFNAREDILVSDIVPVTAFTALALVLQVGILFLLKRFAPLLLVVFAQIGRAHV